MLTAFLFAWIFYELSAPLWVWILLIVWLVFRIFGRLAELADK